MILAKLSGCITLGLQQLGYSWILALEPNRCSRNSNFRQPGAKSTLPGDKRCSSGGATLLSVGVGKQHAFFCEAVDVGCSIPHHAVTVATEILNSDVVSPNHEDVRLLRYFFNFFGHCDSLPPSR